MQPRQRTTTENSRFRMSAQNDILTFSSIGFQTFDLRANEIGTAVTLHKSNSDLNEVVVTALGIKRESRSLGYSAQKVTGSTITQASPPDLAQGLIGKSAGLECNESEWDTGKFFPYRDTWK